MQPQPSQDVVLSAQNIHKSFGTHEVLKGISLDSRNHDVISILGSSGSRITSYNVCYTKLLRFGSKSRCYKR